MIVNQYGLYIDTDFETRVIRETDQDIDMIIPLSDRTLNVKMVDLPPYLGNRMQFPIVKNIIIRLSKIENQRVCTIHFLRHIDLNSSIINFEFDYQDHYIEIKNKTFFTELRLSRKTKFQMGE